MKDVVFLVANRGGVIRMTKRYPSLGREEIGVRLAVKIPDTAFRLPAVSVEVEVAEQQAIQPEVSVEVVGDV